MAAIVAEVAPLPERLMRFFAKYPPKLYSAYYTGQRIPTNREKIAIFGNKKLGIPPSAAITQSTQPSIEDSIQPSPIPSESTSTDDVQSSSPSPAVKSRDEFPPNPFLPRKNYVTGKWHSPRYGLRIQADLVKLAKKHGVEELLPPTRKGTAFKEARILEGLRVKGTGEGQKVKGHKWERTLGATLEKRKAAMEKMPELIREWAAKGHGRNWKKFPK